MLGPIGSNIMSIFRLLSPEEIDRYIDSKEVRKIEGTLVAGGEEFGFEEHQGPASDSSFKNKKQNQEQSSSSGQAEIIPIGKLRRNEEENVQIPNDEPVEKKQENVPINLSERSRLHPPKSQLESVGILSASSLRQIEEERLKNEMTKRDSTTAFLIKERQKMRDSKRKLIEQHAFKMYQSNAAQEFYEAEDSVFDEEENDGSSKGILINKKQY